MTNIEILQGLIGCFIVSGVLTFLIMIDLKPKETYAFIKENIYKK
jgi:hypothetical protein